MGATRFEYRFRWGLHALLYALGFFAPWTFYIAPLNSRETLWNFGMRELAGTRALNFDSAAVLLLCVGIAFLAAGALLRVWGSAYVGSGVVHSPSMHGDALLADGIYRHTRNPLYLGTLLHTFGVALAMPVSGAFFAIVLLWIFQIRLALAEEPFLTARFGEPYRVYAARVPRFLPSIPPRVPAAGAQPHWLQAFLGEIYVLGVLVTFAAFGWSFNSQTLIRGVLISVGVSLVLRAFMPKRKADSGPTLG
jgi:protein-S-isoprenylcysteine O-methyltransferase Ste14